MTAAVAVGMSESEMNEFFLRLERSWRDFHAKREKETQRKGSMNALD